MQQKFLKFTKMQQNLFYFFLESATFSFQFAQKKKVLYNLHLHKKYNIQLQVYKKLLWFQPPSTDQHCATVHSKVQFSSQVFISSEGWSTAGRGMSSPILSQNHFSEILRPFLYCQCHVYAKLQQGRGNNSSFSWLAAVLQGQSHQIRLT